MKIVRRRASWFSFLNKLDFLKAIITIFYLLDFQKWYALITIFPFLDTLCSCYFFIHNVRVVMTAWLSKFFSPLYSLVSSQLYSWLIFRQEVSNELDILKPIITIFLLLDF